MRATTDSLDNRSSFYRQNNDHSGANNVSRGGKREKPSLEQLTIVPVPREELPDEMRSVLESFISSRRPSLADLRSARPEAQHTSTSARGQSQSSSPQGHERYDYDGRNDSRLNGPNSMWPFNFTLKGKNFPPRVYHTRKVVPRSRPNAQKQLGKRKWHPSRRHGRVIRQEDYDAYAVNESGQRTQSLNNQSMLNLSVRSGKAAKGIIKKAVGDGRLWRWPCVLSNKLGKAMGKALRRD